MSLQQKYCNACETAFTIDVKVSHCPCCGYTAKIIDFEDQPTDTDKQLDTDD